MTIFLLTCLGVGASDSLNVRRSRHISNDIIKEHLNTLVTVRCTAAYGNHFICDSRLTDAVLDLVDRKLLALEEFLHKSVILLGNSLDKLLVILLSKLFHIIGDRLDSDIETLIVIINLSFHCNKVDDSSELEFTTDGELNRNGITLETLLHHVDNMIEICAHNVHFVNIYHTRYMILISLTPNSLRLRLNATLCAKDGNGTVKNTKRTLNFNSKVNVTRGINDIDTVTLPETGGSSRSDCDTTLLLLSHPVHCCCTVMCFTHLVVNTGVEKDTLGRSCFTGIDMSHDTDISC